MEKEFGALEFPIPLKLSGSLVLIGRTSSKTGRDYVCLGVDLKYAVVMLEFNYDRIAEILGCSTFEFRSALGKFVSSVGPQFMVPITAM